MRVNGVFVTILVITLFSLMGCAKKVDTKRPVEKIRNEVGTMSLADLESHAAAYAAAIREQKSEITKIQQQIQKMPMKKVFDNKSMARHITEIGQEAEALFERYRIYVRAFQEKGGDASRVQLEPQKS